MIKISVIVAAFNSEKTIRRCLKSICGQSYENLEIILVNDGSKDSTLEIMEAFKKKDARIKIVNQENKGAGLAKNAGLKQATGQYVSFVDSDDWIDLDTYKIVVNKINKVKPDVLVFDHNRVIGNKIQRNVRKNKEETINLDEFGRSKYIIKYMISYNHEYGAWNKIVRRELLYKYDIGFSDNKNTVYDDNLYCLKIICHAQTIYSIPNAFYYYVIEQGSLSDMGNTYDKLALGYSNMFVLYIDYLKSINKYKDFSDVLPYLYYSMVFFGLVRFKHFAHMDVSGVPEKLSAYSFYKPFMLQMGDDKYRCKRILLTLSGVKISNWQVNGLLLLTIIQAKILSKFVLEDKYEKIEKFI